jgi:N-acyl-L-homoserine lactone synthetase
MSPASPFLTLGNYCFRRAQSPDEHEQIRQLLHRTFVLEVRQDADTGTGRLLDKFDHKNTYIVAVHQCRICGVVAVHDQPPFSAAGSLQSGEILEKLCPQLLEARRLSVEPAERSGLVFAGLMWSVYEHARYGGYRYIVISGLLERQGMYAKMGFRPLGSAVRKGEAYFVPMLVDLCCLPDRVRRDRDRWQKRASTLPR